MDIGLLIRCSLMGLSGANDPLFAWRTDASEHRRPGVVGIGLELRRCGKKAGRGPVFLRVGEAYRDVRPGSGEALAIYRALELSRELELPRVQIWCDFNTLRKRLRSAQTGDVDSEVRSSESAILTLAKSIGMVEFRYIPRRRNVRADSLARYAAITLEPEMLVGELAVFVRIGPPAHPHHAYHPTNRSVKWRVSSDDSSQNHSDDDDDPIPF